MRLFVSFQETVYSLDVDVRETVGDIKNTLRQMFRLNLTNQRNETDQFVSLVYQGSILHDSFIYSDLGIPAGSTLVCRVEKQVEPTLTVHCVNYDENLEYKQRFKVWDTSVGTLRSMIQDSTGIHVSAFRLYSNSGVELFDCHPFKVYGVNARDTVTMEIWPDVADVVRAARDNDITDTLGSLASFHDGPHLVKYQLQLGLFIAAHYGCHQLATQLMKCGARPDEPVGQHPSRDWCRASAHVDHVKTPAHEAAQHGRLKCLQHFLMFNHAVLICKDAHGLTPCNIARRNKQTECFKLLVAEQFRIPSVHPELSVHVYSRVRKWCDRARLRARLHKDKTAMLLLTNAEVAQKCAVVGQRVEVDGYNGRGDREVKSAPSSLTSPPVKISASRMSHSTTTLGDYPFDHSLPNPTPREDTNPRGNLQSTCIPFNPGQSTRSGVVSQSNVRLSAAKSMPRPNANEKSHCDRVFRENAPIQQNSRRAKTQSSGNDHPIVSPISTSGCKSPFTSSFVTPRVSRVSLATSRDLSRGIKTREQGARYIWKTSEDLSGNLRMSQDKGKGRTSDGQQQPKSIDIHDDTCEISVNSCWKMNERAVMPSSNFDKKSILQDDRPVLSRGKVGEDRQEVASNNKRQSFASVVCEAYNAHKTGVTSSKSVDDSHQINEPAKQRSDRSRDLVYQGSVESNADKCLRVACDTFRKKSWLGQLQMALVVNTNMCKRR